MRKTRFHNVLLLSVSFCLVLLLCEAGLRFGLQPSPYSYGRFLGKELPPYRLLPEGPLPLRGDRSEWYEGLIVDGEKITAGDLFGIYREDSLLGFAPRENTVSANGWWQSNNIGVRSREATAPEKPPGVSRLLVFGESFAQGSRVRQEDSWPYILDEGVESLEVLNLAVDGYSMAQAYLRYRLLRREIDYDAVLLMLVPASDLWRDVNIRRDVGGEWWGSYISMPRFLLKDGALQLIRPFPPPEVYTHVRTSPGLADSLKAHLRAYDRFYHDRMYASPVLAKHSLLYKLLLLNWHVYEKKKYRNSLWDTNSEAQQIMRKLFAQMKAAVEQDGKVFILVTLPSYGELLQLASDPGIAERHRKLAAAVAAGGVDCVNLLEALRRIPVAELDSGYDGSHYGPKGNRQIARLIRQHLMRQGIVKISQEIRDE